MTDMTASLSIRGSVDASLGRALGRTEKRSKKAAKSVAAVNRRAASETLRLGRSSAKLGQTATRTGRAVRGWTRDTRKLDTALGRTVRQAERARIALKRMRREQGGPGGGMGGATIGDIGRTLMAGAGLRAALGGALTMEAAEVRLKTAINADDKDAAVKAAREQARRLARDGPIDAVEAMNVNYALNSAGLDAATARGGMGSVLKTAKVTGGAAEDVGAIMATAMNNLGDSMIGSGAEKMARVGDLMTKTQLKFQFKNFGQLGDGLAYASSGAAAARVSIEQLLTALGQLNSAGVAGSRAGTAFNASLRSMGKAAGELDFELVRGADGAMDYFRTLKNLNEALADYDDIDDRNDVIQKIFGDEGKAAIIPLLGKLDAAAADLRDVTEGSKGAVEKNYEMFRKSEGGKLKAAINAAAQLGEAIGASLLPAVNMVVVPLGAMAGGLADIIEKHRVLGAAIGAAVAGFGAFKAARILGGVPRLLRGLGGRGRVGGPLGGGVVPVRVVNFPGGAMGGRMGRRGRGGRMGRVGRIGGLLKSGGGLLKSGGGLLGRVSAPLAAAAYIPDLVAGIGSGSGKEIGRALGGAGGTLAGAAIGATIGSVVPIVGTAIGGIAGGVIGAMGGEWLGDALGGLVDGDKNGKAEPERKQAAAPAPVMAAGTVNVTVNPGPGQSPEDIARAVQRVVERERRGLLHD